MSVALIPLVREGSARGKTVAKPVRARHQRPERPTDQSTITEWGSLGEFEFAAGGDQWVEVFDNTGTMLDDQHITADAIRLTRDEIDKWHPSAETVQSALVYTAIVPRFSLSDTDRILIRTLYDRRLKPGMDRRTAMPIALGIIAQHMLR